MHLISFHWLKFRLPEWMRSGQTLVQKYTLLSRLGALVIVGGAGSGGRIHREGLEAGPLWVQTGEGASVYMQIAVRQPILILIFCFVFKSQRCGPKNNQGKNGSGG